MSRIGKRVIQVPEYVNFSFKKEKEYYNFSFENTKTKKTISKNIKVFDLLVSYNENKIILSKPKKTTKFLDAFFGTLNSLLFSMLKGIIEPFKVELKIVGVGYKVKKNNDKLIFSLGFSHQVEYLIDKRVEINCKDLTSIEIIGADKELVNLISAQIRKLKPVEPYKGKGIRIKDQLIKLKVGKKVSK